MKKTFALVIVCLFVMTLFSPVSLAADQTITTSGTYDLSTMSLGSGDTISIANNVQITLVGSTGTTYTNLRILSGAGSEVTLQNVNIDNTGYNTDTLVFFGTGNTLILSGTNNLTGGTSNPGVRVLRDAELEIKGGGVLNAVGYDLLTAGIGNGSDGDASGTIIISGGTVNATGGNSGAGIGGNIHITGGTVTATGGPGGYAIGDGNNSGAVLTVDGCAELKMASGGIESGMMATFGDCVITGAGADSLAGYYVDGVLFTGTVIDMSTGLVTGGGAVPGIDIAIIDSTRDYLVTGSTALRTLRVDISSGLPVDIILFGTSIKPPSFSALNAVIATVNLQLCGSNELYSYGGFAGLHCAPGAEVTISGDGTLTAESASSGAGIGGNSGESGGKITIVSGTVNAFGNKNTGYNGGAGIGGGNAGSGGTILISGGTVNAYSEGPHNDSGGQRGNRWRRGRRSRFDPHYGRHGDRNRRE